MIVYAVGSKDVYHTDRNCRCLQQSTKRVSEWSQEMAEAWDKTECKYCSGEYTFEGKPNQSVYPHKPE